MVNPRVVRFLCVIFLATALAAASKHGTVREEMKFGAEAAQRGLWREAEFRWRKILKDDPDNARVHNNLAVALESFGDFAGARQEYAEARRLAPDSKEIRNNYESFIEFCKSIPSCRADTEAAGSAGGDPSPSPTPGGGR